MIPLTTDYIFCVRYKELFLLISFQWRGYTIARFMTIIALFMHNIILFMITVALFMITVVVFMHIDAFSCLPLHYLYAFLMQGDDERAAAMEATHETRARRRGNGNGDFLFWHGYVGMSDATHRCYFDCKFVMIFA